MAQEWDIKPRGEACYSCSTPYEDEQIYFSALVFEEEGYIRADYCEECWKKREQQAYSSWQGVYRLPPAEPEEALRKETAESLLRKLMEDDDKSKINVIFILAVMLERKKLLVEKDIKTDEYGAITRIYEHRKTGETFVVPDPSLHLDELESVQEEVVVMLGGKPRGEESEEERDEGEDQKPEDGEQPAEEDDTP